MRCDDDLQKERNFYDYRSDTCDTSLNKGEKRSTMSDDGLLFGTLSGAAT